jgi:hypothetical protein
MKKNNIFAALFVVVVNFALIALLFGGIVKLALEDFYGLLKGFTSFAVITLGLFAILILVSIIFNKFTNLVKGVNEITQKGFLSEWHQKNWFLVFLFVLMTPIIYVLSDEGISYFFHELHMNFESFQQLNAHVRLSILMYVGIVGLLIGVIIKVFKNVYFADKKISNFFENYSRIGLVPNVGIAISLTVALLMSHDLMSTELAVRYFHKTTIYILSLVSLFICYLYLCINDNTQSIIKSNFVTKLIPLLFIAYIVISPKSESSHYSEMRTALEENETEKLQSKLYEAIKKASYDSMRFSERSIVSNVEPYKYMPYLDKDKTIKRFVDFECVPQAIYLFSNFTNSNYYDLIKAKVTIVEGLGSYTDEIKQQCFNQLNQTWFQSRSLAIKTVFINSCNQRLIACY